MSNKNKPITTLERIMRLEEAMGNAQHNFVSTQNYLEHLMQKQSSSESSYASIAKTVTALVSDLIDKKLISSKSIMARIREIDENNERDKVRAMVSQNIMKLSSDPIDNNSMFVISEKIVNKPKDREEIEDILSDYRLIDMTSPLFARNLDKFDGKKSGDRVVISADSSDSLTVTVFADIIEVYKINESNMDVAGVSELETNGGSDNGEQEGEKG